MAKKNDGVVEVISSVDLLPEFELLRGVTDIDIVVETEKVPSLSRIKELENRIQVLAKNNEALTKDLNKLKTSLLGKLDEIRKIVNSKKM